MVTRRLTVNWNDPCAAFRPATAVRTSGSELVAFDELKTRLVLNVPAAVRSPSSAELISRNAACCCWSSMIRCCREDLRPRVDRQKLVDQRTRVDPGKDADPAGDPAHGEPPWCGRNAPAGANGWSSANRVPVRSGSRPQDHARAVIDSAPARNVQPASAEVQQVPRPVREGSVEEVSSVLLTPAGKGRDAVLVRPGGALRRRVHFDIGEMVLGRPVVFVAHGSQVGDPATRVERHHPTPSAINPDPDPPRKACASRAAIPPKLPRVSDRPARWYHGRVTSSQANDTQGTRPGDAALRADTHADAALAREWLLSTGTAASPWARHSASTAASTTATSSPPQPRPSAASCASTRSASRWPTTARRRQSRSQSSRRSARAPPTARSLGHSTARR